MLNYTLKLLVQENFKCVNKKLVAGGKKKCDIVFHKMFISVKQDG